MIHALVLDHRPLESEIRRKVWLACAAALAAAVSLYWIILPPRADIGLAMTTPRFAAKIAIMALLAWTASLLVTRLAQPGVKAGAMGLAIAAPAAALAIAVGLELLALDPSRWVANLVGSNAAACLVSIPLLSAPVFGAALYALHLGAPTRPSFAGLTAGLLAGGFGGFLYGTHCPDDSPLFVATWYTIAIAVVALAGGALGPRLLRW